ncbi:RING finger protein 212B isoform X2 [Eurytemora carolleeae]|uniref:RING finger protein 212B isoform X1 n=1 Tax=Eurytemora carolleeae TaxID=1294199 RepID=UPI000C779C11|nr:RING finger protein 212B isoform X1 [Eurytemora carolleeae]XP_023321765.1 RING finger protein 212B isoform X2 [Eurytemora carolleeae]|eukprot:XP_023321764.1 RING finger protein 212B-like isoform X1 [Eurytemora affinis]
MSWVHCNLCFVSPEEDRRVRLNFSSCGKIVCMKCLPKLKNRECKACKNKCRSLELNSNTPKEVTELFSDPMKNLKVIFKSMSFQEKNKLGYMNRLSNELKRYKSELKKLEALNEKKTAELSAAQDKEIKLDRAELALKERLNLMTKSGSSKGSVCGSSNDDDKSRYQRMDIRPPSESGFSNILNCSTGSNGSKPSHVRQLFNPSSPSNTNGASRFLVLKTPHGWHNNKIGRYEPDQDGDDTINSFMQSLTQPGDITKN